MMNLAVEDIAGLLENEIADLVINDNLLIMREWSKPHNCVTLFETGGRGWRQGLTKERSKRHYPTMQIRVRDIDTRNAWARAYNIKEVLHSRANEVIGSAYYLRISCVNGPALLDWDENDRIRLILNFEITRIETT